MTTPREQLHVGTRTDLRRRGLTRSQVDALIADGTLVHLGNTWLGTEATPAWLRPVLRGGLRLTCVDSLALAGVQVPLTQGVHVVGRRGARLRLPTGAVAHLGVRTWPDTEPAMPLRLALVHASRCLPPRDLGITLDSVTHLALLGSGEIEEFVRTLPGRTRRAIGTVEPRAESATESRVIRDIRQHGVQVRPQWMVPGVGRTDMLVGERLIIECDSVAHHTALPRYAADRRRDRLLVGLGYVVVRLTWEDVMLRWPETWEYLLALLRRGVHRAPRGRRRLLPGT